MLSRVYALLALLLCARAQMYASPVVAPGKVNVLNLGLLGPFSPSPSASFWGLPGALGWLQALDDINARSDLLPRHFISGFYNTSDGDMGAAVAATTELVRA